MMRTVWLGQEGWARAASGSADAAASVKTLSADFIERDYLTLEKDPRGAWSG